MYTFFFLLRVIHESTNFWYPLFKPSVSHLKNNLLVSYNVLEQPLLGMSLKLELITGKISLS
jgi:hypothetical protein